MILPQNLFLERFQGGIESRDCEMNILASLINDQGFNPMTATDILDGKARRIGTWFAGTRRITFGNGPTSIALRSNSFFFVFSSLSLARSLASTEWLSTGCRLSRTTCTLRKTNDSFTREIREQDGQMPTSRCRVEYFMQIILHAIERLARHSFASALQRNTVLHLAKFSTREKEKEGEIIVIVLVRFLFKERNMEEERLIRGFDQRNFVTRWEKRVFLLRSSSSDFCLRKEAWRKNGTREKNASSSLDRPIFV